MPRPRSIAAASFAAALLVPTAAAPAAARPPRHPHPAAVVPLGVPLSDVLLIGGTVAPGPDGRPALWNVSTGKPAYLNAVDPATGARLVTAPLPGAEGGWAVTAAPDGSVYAGTYNDGHLYRWRPGSGDTVEDLGQPIPGQSFVWRLASDEDGNIYGGTSPGGRVFRYDPRTGAFRDYGQPVPGQTYVKSIAVMNGKVYTGSYAQAHIAELDPATGVSRELPKPPGLESIEGQQVYDINARDGRLYVRIGNAFPSPMFVYDVASGQWTDEIPQAHGLDVSPAGDDGEIYLIQQSELKRYDPATKKLTGTGLTFTGRVQNARSIGWAELGLPDYPGKSIVGTLWRGDMFRYNPQTGEFAILPTDVRREPIEILSVAAGKRRAYAGGFLNGGLSLVDPADGKATFNRFSQVESVLEASDGRVWIGTYPEARLYSYDPAKPWSSPEYSPGPEGTPDNPKLAVNLKADLQMRARALAEVDGKIAVGTVPDGDRLGGALAIYDPRTGKTQVTRNVVQDESVFGLTARGRVVYGGTSITGGLGTTKPTRDEGTVFAWDTARSRKLWESVPVPGAGTVNSVVIGPDRKLWGVAGKTVFSVDPRTGRVLKRYALGSNTTGGDIVATRTALYASLDGGKIVRIDPSSRRAPTVVVEHAVRRLAAQGEHRLVFSDGANLFRVDLPH
ncbi:PQQ-binding-like beta-propeller repeat protein [Actinomadura atramentaria]|uniref:PQQ-binding-like beta-propeller repeat protein n=1 Tax=Actinomadura atramentaria TaxID=1990 RepID=UPI000371B21D|nr:PQQ-binding-like beta-propeller repeat protein [Actinomadura atramentaria]